jgi:pseudaminic acid synthase
VIQIATRTIGLESEPFVIAEMSGNHNNSLERALEIVDAAAESGAHALKIQTYTAETITIKSDRPEFRIEDEGSLWSGRTLFDLYDEACLPWDWHKAIFDRCTERGMIGFSTPFDETAVAHLESLNVQCYKIASFEIIDLPLIRLVAQTGKPIIMSTGMADVGEIHQAVETARSNGCEQIVLLKCTSSYPAKPSDSNILTIPHLRDMFGTEVGISDHTLGTGVSVAAVALGATVIEKHFTLDRSAGGVDSDFSLEPDEFKRLVEESARAHASLGRVQYGQLANEKTSKLHRRSLYVVEDVEEGTLASISNVRSIRPGNGLEPGLLDLIIGKKFTRSVKKGNPLSWDLFF